MKTMRFEELDISNEIKRAVEDMGFEEATPIQSESIPYLLEGKDVIGQAQTGTGKTTAFGIPILEKINPKINKPQTLILCPTRELAIQVSEEISRLSKYKKGVKLLPVYGGQPIDRQIRALKKGVQVIIGTPGRVMDHMRRKTLKTDHITTMILDEADEMLNMGFREDIETVLEDLPEDRQTVFFSATMPKSILDLTKKYQNNPKLIKVVHKKLTVPNIEQRYLEVKERDKLEILSRLIDIKNPKLAIIFCNTKRKVDDVMTQLQGRGYFSDGLHGDMKQRQRDNVMSKFRSGNIEILVATDVAARGIDVDDVEMVFNYDVPQDEEYYVHRIGRTGRAGRTGIALTFVGGKKDFFKLKDIQRYTKTKIKRHDIPSVSDVEEIKANLFMDKVKEVIEQGGLSKYIDIVEDLLGEDYTSMDVAAALLKMQMRQENEKPLEKDVSFENTGAEPGMVRLFINIGRKDQVNARHIVGAIAGETNLSGKVIGAIDIYDKYTFVEIPREHAREVIRIMQDNQIKGKSISIEPANPK